MWARIFVIVIAIATAMAFAAKRSFPDLEFNWVRAVAGSIALFVIYLGSFVVLLWWVPPRIQINHQGVCRQQGQSVRWRLRDDVQSITVEASDPDHPRMRVESRDKKPWELGIGAKVNILDLVNCLRENFPNALIAEKK